MPWQPAHVWPMTLPRSMSPASVIGISGAGGALPCCANAGAPKAQAKTVKAAAKKRDTGGGSQEIPFSKARILAKTQVGCQGRKPHLAPPPSTDLYGFRGGGFRGRIEMAGDAALGGARAIRD